jgi:ribosome-binding factor A
MGRRFKAQFDKRPVRFGVFPCDELRPGDGQDPRFDKDEFSRKSVVNRKALQLCAQVKDTLNMAFSQMADATLRELYVQDVVPAPDSTQLLATVITDKDVSKVSEQIAKAHGLLRSEVASGINRKRVPQLKFNVVNNGLSRSN